MSRRKTARSLNLRVALIASLLEEHLGIPVPPTKVSKPLDMLIATILSQNTNDTNSYRAYNALKAKFPSWEEVENARIDSIVAAIKTGGMANQKSKRIKAVLKELRKRYNTLDLSFIKKKSNEEIFDMLISLDGVGTKTASCVLLFSLKREVFPVDTHIFRICNRLGLTKNSKTPDNTFYEMQSLIPDGKAYSFHTNLIRFGRKICKAGRPLCGMCPVFSLCEFKEKEKFSLNSSSPRSDSGSDFMILDNVG